MRTRRFMITSDNHGNHIDWQAARVAYEFQQHFKPHDRFSLGDVFNVAKFRRGASEHEKRQAMKDDIAQGLEYLRKFDPHVRIVGNHCHRLDEQYANGNEEAGLWLEKIRAVDEALDTHVVAWGKKTGWHRYGNHLLGHGYGAGMHAAMTHAQFNQGHTIVGHVHYNSGPVPTKTRHPSYGYTCGCLCALDQDYNLDQLGAARQNWGFIYGYKLPDGKLDVRHAMIDSDFNLLVGDY